MRSGKQSIPAAGPASLVYGQSITDGCISWTTTVSTLDKLRAGVQARRKLGLNQSNGLNKVVRQVALENERAAAADFNDVNMFPVA